MFDPLPSQVLGNITNINNSGEPVLGYFSGGQVTEKRLFINYSDLPYELMALRERVPCVEENIGSLSVDEIPKRTSSTLLIDPIYVQDVGVVGYTTADSYCIDCRIKGGSTTQPIFW